MRYQAYPDYIKTSYDNLPSMPLRWRIERIHNVATIKTSNVDKKSVENQDSVKLCNYVDVYNNDKITRDIDFMTATASSSEKERFKLKLSDVVITKDSESPFDIGIASLIAEDIEDLVCGYHLSIIEPNEKEIFGPFLYYALSCETSVYQFSIAANGVTRFGLSYNGTKNLKILVPNIDEQKKIANFLDYKTKQIDQLIEKKKALIEKLNEQRIAVITHAVTKGLDETVPMKNSGVDWLGQVPEHWDVRGLKFCFDFLNNKRIPLSAEERTGMAKNYPYYGASGVIDYVQDYIFDEPTVLVAEDGANLLSRSTPLSFIADGKYWVNNHAHILRPVEDSFDYWADLLCTIEFDPWITGSAQPKLTKDNLGTIQLLHPPIDEQYKIAKFINQEKLRIDPMIESVSIAVERLEEYRIALITAAVTGKIDVRNVFLQTLEE